MLQSTNNLNVCTELFNKLYDETFVELRKFIAIKCSDISYVSDILQETYLEFFSIIQKKGPSYVENNRALLYTIAKRKVYGFYFSKAKFKTIVLPSGTNEDKDEYPDVELQSIDDTEATVLTKLESQRIWLIISTYPKDIRKIFYLFFYEDMTHSQIAEALHYNLSTVKNKLYRTINEIRQKENTHDE